MKTLLIVHYPQEADKFKYILPSLGEVTVIYDTTINLSNKSKWISKFSLQEIGVPKRPWWYLLSRYSDDYKFFKKLPNSVYYQNRAWKSYPNWAKPFLWLPLRFLKYFYKAPKYIRDHIEKFKPDLILTTSLAFPSLHVQVEYVLEGKRRGIPTISLLTNHDALTTKAKMYPIPDYVFCWNDNHVEELKYHGVKFEQIRKVGAFSFEDWLRPQKTTRRDKFYRTWHLDSKKPIYVYLTSSYSIAGWETKNVEQWRDYMKEYYPHAQLVVRPHPDQGHLMNLISGIISIPKISEGVFENDAFQLAWDTYAYSQALFCINTSAAIEAMLVGKPVYALDTKLENKLDFGGQSGLHFAQLKPLLNDNGPNMVRNWLGVDKKLPSELVLQEINAIIKK